MLGWLERNRSSLAAILVVLIAVAALVLLQLPRRSALQVSSPSGSGESPPIKVHVVGAVAIPGVYQLAADARVEDALRAAGGPTEAADVDSLNLATPLRDGQQVVVPRAAARSPAAASPATPSPAPRPARLDLNAASRKELEALPGVGTVTAQRILEYRERNGRIIAIEELRDAKLVNASTYERIKGLVETR